MDEEISLPKELLWDYREAPDNIVWRLQRIADFFPGFGKDRKTVELLFKYRDKLKLETGKYRLICIYHEVWKESAEEGN